MILIPFYWFYWWFYSHSTDDSTPILLMILISFYWWFYSHSTAPILWIMLGPVDQFYWQFFSQSTNHCTPILLEFYWWFYGSRIISKMRVESSEATASIRLWRAAFSLWSTFTLRTTSTREKCSQSWPLRTGTEPENDVTHCHVSLCKFKLALLTWFHLRIFRHWPPHSSTTSSPPLPEM